MVKKKILIVENEKIIAEDIRRTLIGFNYNVVGIVSIGKEAIEKAAEFNPDLVLMDIKLEGSMDGIETAERIYHSFNTPIIFLTAYANEKILQKATSSAPFGYLIKPFEDRELQATIEMAFYKSKMENALKESRNFLWRVIDTVPNYIFVKDRDSKYIMVNKAYAKTFNTTPKKMIGKTDFDYVKNSKLRKEDAERFALDDKRVLETEKPIFILEDPVTNKDGYVKWVQTTKVPLDSPGKPGVLLGVSVDISARKKAEEDLKASFERLQKLMEETVNGLVSAVEMRDPYTAGHQRRVSSLACAIAEEMKLEKNTIDGLRIASIVHDIGKIYVPSEILSKPGKLTEAEFDLIKTHSKAGYDILSSIQFPWPVAEIVLQHHERINGSGYPQGIENDKIIFESRILGVADVVEATSSHRPYRPALGIEFALNEITTNKGTLYDKEVVEMCVKVFNEKKFQFKD